MNNFKVLIFNIVGICFFNFELNAQVITWQHVYGDSGEDVGYSVAQTFDGGYIMAGLSQTGQQTRVIRTSAFGEIIWNKFFGGNIYEKIIQTKDSCFVLVGYAQGVIGFNSDGYIIKINKEGNLVWWKKYGGKYDDYFHDLLITPDNKFLIVGTYTSQKFPNIRNMFLVKTDSNGNEIWSKSYDSTGSGFNIDEIEGRGYLLSGSTEIYVDYNGIKKYSRRALGINGLNTLNNNGFIFFDNKDTIGISAIRILRTDTTFNDLSTSWIYKPDRLLFGNEIIKDKDSYVIGGENFSFQGDQDAYIVKIDITGKLIWDRTIPPRFEYNEFINSIYKCSDSGYIALGTTSPFSGNPDFLGIKTDKNGNTVPVSIVKFSSLVMEDYLLFQNFPNPFNSQTKIRFTLPNHSFVNIAIFNTIGEKIENLLNEYKAEGDYTIKYDASNLPSGIYFYTMSLTDKDFKAKKVITKKLVLLK